MLIVFIFRFSFLPSGMHNRNGDDVLESLESSDDEASVGPGTGEGHVQVVPVGFGLEGIGWVGGDKVAE